MSSPLVAAAFSLLLASGPPVAPSSPSVAEQLFQDGLSLLKEGEIDAACSKLEESVRLDTAMGALALLARCHEEQGRLKTALLEYERVIKMAQQSGHDGRVQMAMERAEALSQRVPLLDLKLPRLPMGTKVTLDDSQLSWQDISTPLRVDPGHHELRISAPGHQTVVVPLAIAERSTLQLEVPALKTTPPPSHQKTEAPFTLKDKIGLSLASGGAALLAVGGFFAVDAVLKNDASKAHCEENLCDERGTTLRRQAIERSQLAKIFMIPGGAALGGGGLLVLWPDSKKEMVVSVGHKGPWSIELQGSF